MSSTLINGDSATSARLKVFLSYSRRDSAFAEELVSALELVGFDAYLDKEDIAPGEPWEERLGNLIRLADTVVFVLSPASLASEHCTWEVDETARAGKRLVPILLAEVPDKDVPERLRKLNYVLFSSGHSFSKGLGNLTRALRADAPWIREHTRYAEMANRWVERGKPAALLLRGSDLDDARRWIVARPSEAPEISAPQQGFIEASALAADEELAAKARLRKRTQVGLAAITLAMAALAIVSAWQWRAAEAAKRSLEHAVHDLDASNARLERKLALRVTPRGYEPYDIPAGWFQVATRYAGSVAFVAQNTAPAQLTASGVLVNASMLNPKWPDRPVFVTATYVVADNSTLFRSALPADQVQIVMFGPRNERRTARLGAVMWQSDVLGVSVSTIEDRLPDDITAIKSADALPEALSRLQTLSPGELTGLFDDKAILTDSKEHRPIVLVGNLQGRNEVAISISHLIGGFRRLSSPAVSKDFPQSLSRSITPTPVAPEVQPDLVYTYGTLPGSGGSPIFDAETGDLIGIHLLSVPCGRGPKGCAAAGTSFPRLLAAIRAK